MRFAPHLVNRQWSLFATSLFLFLSWSALVAATQVLPQCITGATADDTEAHAVPSAQQQRQPHRQRLTPRPDPVGVRTLRNAAIAASWSRAALASRRELLRQHLDDGPLCDACLEH